VIQQTSLLNIPIYQFYKMLMNAVLLEATSLYSSAYWRQQRGGHITRDGNSTVMWAVSRKWADKRVTTKIDSWNQTGYRTRFHRYEN
jgi:hypothetical protein